jgi:hypothetical protein
MLLEVDISLRDLLQQMLTYNSSHTLLYFLAELENHPNAEEFANAANKLLIKYEE